MTDQPAITEASHRLCAAFHMEGIDPAEVEVHMPREAWWRLQCRLEQIYRGIMRYDGRGYQPDRFQFMGIVYRVKE